MKQSVIKNNDGSVRFIPNPNDTLTRPEAELIETDIFKNYKENLSKKMFVKSNYQPFADGGDIVAFTEKNAAHPNAEVYVAGSNPTFVTLTARVAQALNDGLILESTIEEIEDYQTKKIEQTKAVIDAKKEFFRVKYIAVVGSEKGFNAAWEENAAKESLDAIMKMSGAPDNFFLVTLD